MVQRYGLQVSDAVREHLADDDNETPKPGDPCFARVSVSVAACAQTFLAAAAAYLVGHGVPTHILSDSLEGEARDVARVQAALLGADRPPR